MLPVAGALVFTGCIALRDNVTFFWGPISYDVTSKPAWWGEMHRGEIVALNDDTLLNGGRLTLGAYKETGTYSSGAIFKRSITVEMFKANPGKYWEDLHLLPKGTRFRCKKLERFFSSNTRDYIITAEILDGEFNGKTASIEPYGGNPDKKGSMKLGPNCLVHAVE